MEIQGINQNDAVHYQIWHNDKSINVALDDFTEGKGIGYSWKNTMFKIA